MLYLLVAVFTTCHPEKESVNSELILTLSLLAVVASGGGGEAVRLGRQLFGPVIPTSLCIYECFLFSCLSDFLLFFGTTESVARQCGIVTVLIAKFATLR